MVSICMIVNILFVRRCGPDFGSVLALLEGMKSVTKLRSWSAGGFGADNAVERRQREPAGRSQMRYLKYGVLVGILALSLGSVANAQVRVGVGIGVGPAYVGPAPVCAYGYYPSYPYACAPYGYWGSDYFVNGVFIGAGPWFHGFYGPRFYGRDWDHDRFHGDRGWDRGRFRGDDRFRGGDRLHGGDRFHGGGGFRGGNESRGGNGFHGGGAVRGGGGFHGGGGSRGGGGFHGGGGGHGGGHR
jgi:hypothetical protein